jgi:phospholipid/cholesterol/gamma-HCH transport system substrate-binding protein
MRPFSKSVSHQPSTVTIAIAALAAAGLLLGLAFLAWVAPRGVPLLRYYDLDAQFSNAAQIADLSQVRIAGRNVGQVTSTEYRGGRAIVHLALYPGQGPLRSDTTARIQLKGLLGGKYVEIRPGSHGRELRSGSTLPARQTSTAVDLVSFLQTFDKPTQENLQVAVRGLGQGFIGRGVDVAQTLNVAPPFLNRLRTISSATVGRTGAAARLAPSAELLTSAYDPVRQDLATGFVPEDQVMQAFVDKTPQVEQTLDAAPASLTALRQGLDAATPLLNETAGLARAAIALTGPAPAALRQASTLLRDAAPALRVTGPPLQSLANAVPQTLSFLTRVKPVITPTIVTLEKSIPPLKLLGSHGCDVLSYLKNWRSALAFGVATGSGALSAGQPGLGPLNSLRVAPVRLLSELLADVPQANLPARDPNPPPCVAVNEHQ